MHVERERAGTHRGAPGSGRGGGHEMPSGRGGGHEMPSGRSFKGVHGDGEKATATPLLRGPRPLGCRCLRCGRSSGPSAAPRPLFRLSRPNNGHREKKLSPASSELRGASTINFVLWSWVIVGIGVRVGNCTLCTVTPPTLPPQHPWRLPWSTFAQCHVRSSTCSSVGK